MTSQPPSELINPPPSPLSDHLHRTHAVLLNAHAVSLTCLDLFDYLSLSTDRDSDYYLDIQIRAMLVFASAGMDSAVKHLIKDALPVVIKRDEKARERLREFVEGRIQRNDQPDYRVLSGLLVAESPIDQMTALLVGYLTASSLQSVDELLRVASYFNIESTAITSTPNNLRRIFRMRNEIIHEMDIDSSSMTEGRLPSVRNLRPRARGEMVEATNQLLGVAAAFLAAVDAKLN